MTDLRNNTNDTRASVEKRANGVRRTTPPVDIYENAEGFLILADVPGVDAESLQVQYNPPELWVSAQRNDAGNGDAVVFERRFELGSGIDPNTISAELKAGVLRIELKKSAALRPRRISVRAA